MIIVQVHNANTVEPAGTAMKDTRVRVALVIEEQTAQKISMNVRPTHICVRTLELVQTQLGVIDVAVDLGGLAKHAIVISTNVSKIGIYAIMEHVPIHMGVIIVVVHMDGKGARVIPTLMNAQTTNLFATMEAVPICKEVIVVLVPRDGEERIVYLI